MIRTERMIECIRRNEMLSFELFLRFAHFWRIYWSFSGVYRLRMTRDGKIGVAFSFIH